MTALNFPSSPTIGQTYTANGGTWEWDGTTWVSKNILDVTLGGTGASTFTSQRLLVGQGTTAVTSSLIADNGTRVTVNAPTTLTAPNSSAAAWLTSGINLVVSPATFTDTSSSGTIGDVYINRFGTQTMAATSATTVTRLFGAYFANPAAGTNVTASNPYALGTDSLRVEGTVFVAASGAGSVQLGSSTTTGQTILGGTSQTGTMTLGQSTVSQTTNIQAGATASGSTKTINIGGGGLAGSTTTISIGSTASATSMTVNGSVTASGSITTSSSGTGLVRLGTDSGGSISLGKTDGTTSFPFIDFNSGATAVDYDVRIAAAGGTGTSGNGGLTITAASTTLTGILSTPLGSVTAPSHTFTGDTNTGMWSPAADTLAFSTNGIERMRVINVGNVVINYNTTFPTALAIAPQFSVGSIANGTGGGITLGKYRNNGALGADFELTKSRSSTVGANSIGANNDLIGTMTWSHADGTGFVQAASISANIDGIPGTNDMPGRLVFSTTADGASTPTERMRIDSSGNVGIGTSSPSQKLDVTTSGGDDGIVLVNSSASGGRIRLDSTGTGGRSYHLNSTANGSGDGGGKFVIRDSTASDAARFVIDSSGNVGIGTSTPGVKLDVAGTIRSTGTSVGRATLEPGGASNSGFTGYYNSAGTRVGYIGFANDSSGIFLINSEVATNAMTFSTAATERMRITSAGNVGIGTSSPDANTKLDVSSSSFNIVASRSTTSFAAFQRFSPAGQQAYDFYTINGVEVARITADGANLLAFSTGSAATERMRIDSSGNVGIGTTSPAEKLSVSGNAQVTNASYCFVGTTSGTVQGQFAANSGGEVNVRAVSNHPLNFFTNNAERMRIDASGNVMVGTTSATGMFSVAGLSYGSMIGTDRFGILGNNLYYGAADFRYIGNGHAYGWSQGNTDGADLRLLYSGNNTGGSGAAASVTERLYITAAGNIGIGTSSPTSRLTITGGDAEIRDGNYLMLRPVGNGWDMRLQATGTQLDVLSGGALGSPIMSLVNGGNVGIGTSSPASLLHVKRGSNAIEVYPAGTWATRAINATDGSGENGFVVGNRWAGTGSTVFEAGSIYGGGTGSWYSYYKIDGTGQSFWSNGGTERMRLDTSGNVGIGTTAPTAKLHVQGTGYFNDDLTVNGGQVFTGSTQARVKFGVWTDTTYGIGMQSGYTYGGLVNDYAMTFQFSNTNTRGFWWGDSSHTNAQGAMALTTNGKLTIAHSVRVGFGETDTTVPGSVYILDVSGAANIIGNTNIGGSSGTYQGLSIRNSDDSAVGETVNFIDARNNLGTATGSFFFHNQTDGGAYITLGNTPAGDRATDRRAERVRILANGNVGIGTTAAAQRLHVRQDQDGTTAAIIQNRNATGSPASALQFISGAFDLTDNRYAMISSTGGGSNTLQFWTAAGASPTQKMVITSAGNVGIGVASPPQLLALGNTTDQVGAGVSGAVSTLYFGSPSTGSGGIKRLAYDRATGALTFIGGGVVDPSTQMTIASGGEITAAVDFRAPIFYDSNDTGKYLNPNGSSFLIGTTVITRDSNSNDTFGGLELRENNVQGAATGAANEAPGVNFHWSMRGAARIYMNGSGHFVFAGQTDITNNRRDIYFASSYAATDSRAPIFYDSNNTAYYVDPNGATSLRTTGDWRADSSAWTGEFNGKIQYHSNNWYFQGSGQWEFRRSDSVNAFVVNQAGECSARSDFRAPIFYDSNNTAYYINPNGDSNLYKTFTYLGGRDVNANWNTGFQNTLPQSYNFHGDLSSGGPSGTWWFYESMRHSNASNYWGTQIAWGWEDNANRLFQRNVTSGTFGSWVEYLNTSGRTYTGNLTMTGSIISSASDVRAPIFYDQNDTAWYCDPNSTSKFATVGIQTPPTASSYLNIGGYNAYGGTGYNGFLTIFNSYGSATNPYQHWRLNAGGGFEIVNSAYNAVLFTFTQGGDFTASGNVTAYSDRKLKTSFRPITDALSKVLQLNGVTFTRIDKEDTMQRYAGLVAQDVEPVLPEAVQKNDTMSYGEVLSVDYNGTIALLVEAIKEQQLHINNMQKEIEILKGDK